MLCYIMELFSLFSFLSVHPDHLGLGRPTTLAVLTCIHQTNKDKIIHFLSYLHTNDIFPVHKTLHLYKHIDQHPTDFLLEYRITHI